FSIYLFSCFLSCPLPRRSILFPYTTLFRSAASRAVPRHPLAINPHRGLVRAIGFLTQARGRMADVKGIGDLSCSACRHPARVRRDRKSTRLNSSHVKISYAVFCLKKKISVV